VHILGEIVEAKDFDDDNLYIFSEMRLHDEWVWDDQDYTDPRATKTDEPDLINRGRSITQMSRAVPRGKEREPVSYFCFPINWSLVASDHALLGKWPEVCLQVNSCDDWGRHRIEGYGFLQIPNEPGFYRVEVPTFRPVEDLYAEVYSYYLGGSVRIEDPWEMSATFSFDEESNKSSVNRYGLTTISAGQVVVQFSVVVQTVYEQQRIRKDVSEVQLKQKSELAWRQKERKTQEVMERTLTSYYNA
jgi:hypothetical protein